tara:strand:- start:76 stop:558 length:483 start_codon:yes stop_codon:yes gene_type:complete
LIEIGSGIDLSTLSLQISEKHSKVSTTAWTAVLEAFCEQLESLGRASVLDLHQNAQFQHVRMIRVQSQQLIKVRPCSIWVSVQPSQIRHQQSRPQGPRFPLQEGMQHPLGLLKSAQGQKPLQKLALPVVVEALICELLHQITDLSVHHQTAASSGGLRSE